MAAAVTSRDWRRRKPGTHTREVRSETVSREIVERLAAAEMRIEQLVALTNQHESDLVELNRKLALHDHETKTVERAA
jgi:hypothetical protein